MATVTMSFRNNRSPELGGWAANAYCKATDAKQGFLVYKGIVAQLMLRAQEVEARFVHEDL